MRATGGTIALLSVVILLGTVADADAGSRSRKLDEECSRDEECAEGSRCQVGFCRCSPYFARFNETRCLEATLLGQECLVDEQCTLKVANSECLDSFCGCKEGFLQFRRHTCLGPAKLGQVCYEHAHCRLWQRNSHCDFLIPNLFGRCQCTAPMRRENDVCRPDNLVRPPPLSDNAAQRPAEDQQQTTEAEQQEEETGVQLAWLKNGTAPPPIPLLPLVDLITGANSIDAQTDRLLQTHLRDSHGEYEQEHEGEGEREPEDEDEDDAIVVDAVTETATSMSASASKTDRHEGYAATPVTLGLECASDLECRLADSYSRCIAGVCDCGFKGNGTCAARNTGCAAGTFQCRSSGVCISWFFVCDGRADCADGSDERCSEQRHACPEQAFRCGTGDHCVSRAMLCDGNRDCPRGEDEIGCNDRRKCPEGAFRCNNGQCLPAYEFCNAVVSCRDGSDEPRGACRTTTRAASRARLGSKHCPFRCENGRCRSDAIVCSGRDGCGDASDEKRCSVCRCPRFA